AVHDLPRIMRLPGTRHLKDASNIQLVELTRGTGQQWSKVGLVEALGLNELTFTVTSQPPNGASPFEATPGAMTAEAIRARYAGTADAALSSGIEIGWLNSANRLEVIRHAAAAIPPEKVSREHDWQIFARALAHTAWQNPDIANDLWTILDDISSRARGYNLE